MSQPKRLKLLSPGQRRLLAVVIVGAGFMLANSTYLALAAHVAGVGDDPYRLPVAYQVMLVLHIVVGIAIFLPAIVFAIWHLKRALLRKSKGTVPTGVGVLLGMTILFVTGFFILTAANTRDNAWAFIAHQAFAVLLPVFYYFHRRWSHDPPAGGMALRSATRMLLLVLVVGVVHGIEASMTEIAVSEPRTHRAELEIPEVWRNPPIDDPFVPFQARGDVDPESPFFPAASTTSSGGPLPARIIHHDDFPDREAFLKETRENGFAPSYYLGAQTCERCHPDAVQQWAASAHRFASFNNPFYRRAVELTRETTGRKESQWCGGCHDPAIMLAGNFEKDIDPIDVEAQAGLTCLACHAIDRLHGITGNGNYNIQDEVPSPYLGSTAKSGLERLLHDYVLKAKPTVHKQRLMKPFFKTSEFCAPCHKVSLDVPVNGYRWIRGQDEYDAWQNSGVNHSNPMTWYEPPATQECQDCHMPLEAATLGDVAAKNGKIKSHRFLAANTALPYIRGDQDTIDRIEAYLQDAKMRVDVFALRRNGGPPLMALDKTAPVVKAGDALQIDVVVRNQGVGHTFPGGTNDSNEGWLRFKVTAPGGVTWESGYLEPDRHVERGAHFFRAVLVDKNGARIAKRNAPDIYATVYANVIPPSGSDLARYTITLPDDLPAGDLVIEADLLWRKFNQEYMEFVYEGKDVPKIPITTIAGDRVNVAISGTPTDGDQSKVTPDDWKRFNDYGIALTRDGVTRDAVIAFRRVAELVPARPDGWRNQARVHLMEGALSECERMLRKASAAAPEDYKTSFWWGRLFEERGGADLDQAVTQFEAVTKIYPDARVVWERLARTYFHQRRWKDAIGAFLEVLRIDPEHALAHEKRGEAYAALAEAETDPSTKAAWEFAAGEARRAYLKYKIDEDAQKATLPYRDKNPEDQRMSQRVVVHELQPRS